MSHAMHPDQLQAQTHMQIWTSVNFVSGKDISRITPQIIILQRKKIAKLDSLKIKNRLWEKLSREWRDNRHRLRNNIYKPCV